MADKPTPQPVENTTPANYTPGDDITLDAVRKGGGLDISSGLQIGPDGLPILPAPAAVAKPVTSQTIPAVSKSSLSQPTPEGAASRAQAEAEGGAVPGGQALVPGQEVDVTGGTPMTEEEQAALIAQDPTARLALEKRAAAERQRMPSEPARSGERSIAEAVRDAVPQSAIEAFKKITGERAQRLKGLLEGGTGGLTGIPEIDAAIESINVPAEVGGDAIAAFLQANGVDRQVAENVGLAVAMVGSVVYGTKSPTAFGGKLAGGAEELAKGARKGITPAMLFGRTAETLESLGLSAEELAVQARAARDASGLVRDLPVVGKALGIPEASAAKGTPVFHGTSRVFEKADLSEGMWVAESPKTASAAYYTEMGRNEMGVRGPLEDAIPNVRPYVLASDAKIAPESKFNYDLSQADNVAALRAEGFDAVAFSGEGSGKGKNYLVLNPEVLVERFTGETAAVIQKLADDAGTDPRFAQEAILASRRLMRENVDDAAHLNESLADAARANQMDVVAPSLTDNEKGLAMAGGAAALLAISMKAEQEGGVTESHIEASIPGAAGNKRLMKVLIDAVRRLRQVPGKVQPLPAATSEQALDVLTTPTPTIKVGDKLLGMDWVGMSQDADHLPATIKIVREAFEKEIKADSRGVVSHEMERRMAQNLIDMGLDPEVVKAKWAEGGRAVVSTEIMATAELAKAAYKEVDRLAAIATRTNGSGGSLEEYGRALGVFSSIVQVLDGQAEEAGRALGVFRALVPDIPTDVRRFAKTQGEMAAKGLAPAEQGATDAGLREAATRLETAGSTLKNRVRKAVEDALGTQRSFPPSEFKPREGERPSLQGKSLSLPPKDRRLESQQKALLNQIDGLVDQWNSGIETSEDWLKDEVGKLVSQWNDQIEKPYGQRTFLPDEGERRRPDPIIEQLKSTIGDLVGEFNSKVKREQDPLMQQLMSALKASTEDFNQRGLDALGARRGNPRGMSAPPTPGTVAATMMLQAQRAQQQYAQYLSTMLDAWNNLPKSQQRSTFLKELGRWGIDFIKELWYSSMLFTFPGQIANAMGNTSAMLGEQMSRALGVGIGAIRHDILGLGPEGMKLGEITEGSFVGMMASITEAFSAAGRSFVTGQSEAAKIMGESIEKTPRALTGERVADVLALANIQIPNAVYHGVNALGMTVGAGTRSMLAGDEWFKVINFRGELYRLGYVEAQRQGLKGSEFGKYMETWMSGPPAEAAKAAKDYAHYVTFTNPLTGKLQMASRIGKSLPMLPFTPFFDTLANIFKYEMEWMPGLNMLVKKSREDLMTPGPRQDRALAKLGIGSAMLAVATGLYMNGNLSGKGPSDYNMRRTMQDVNKYQPNSFVFRDSDGKRHYIGINRLDPINFPFLFAANYGDIALEALNGRGVSQDTVAELGLAGVLALGEVATTRNYMQGWQQALEIAMAKELSTFNKFQKIGNRIAGQVVPSAGAQITRSTDENIRAVYTAMDMIYSRLPWTSKDLYPEINLKGEPRFKTAALGPDWVSPFPYSKEDMDPVGKSFLANGVAIEKPSRSLFGPPPPPLVGEEKPHHGILMTPKQQHRYEVLAGNGLKIPADTVAPMLQALGYDGPLPTEKMGMWDLQAALLKVKSFTNLEPATQAKVQRSIVQGFRQAAAGQLLKEDKDLREKFFGKVMDRAELFGGPRARAMAEQAIRTSDMDAILNMTGNE